MSFKLLSFSSPLRKASASTLSPTLQRRNATAASPSFRRAGQFLHLRMVAPKLVRGSAVGYNQVSSAKIARAGSVFVAPFAPIPVSDRAYLSVSNNQHNH